MMIVIERILTAVSPKIRETSLYKRSVYLPENLDIDELLRTKRPRGFRPDSDTIRFILSQLYEIPVKRKSLLDEIEEGKNPFIPLSSQILKGKVHNYQFYLVYLKSAGVIETDGRYVVGEKSIGYRFTSEYARPYRKAYISGEKFTESRQQQDLLTVEALAKYPELLKWFDGLEIDKNAALEHLEAEKKMEMEWLRKKYDVCINRYASYEIMIDRIVNKDFFFKIDQFSNRLHTILSNIKSSLRKFITFRGKKLISVDLSGSQPFLFLNLLTPSFYQEKIEKNKITLSSINFNLLHPILSPLGALSISSIMCGSFERNEDLHEIDYYKSLVKNNELYEYCLRQLEAITGRRHSRKSAKKLVLSVFFTPNDHPHPYSVRNRKVFEKIFPFISQVVWDWKEKEGNNLAKVLQKLESYLFLECIVPRIIEERPDIPIFTIHDNIVSLVDEADYLLQTSREEIRSRTDFTPHFKTEKWY